MNMRRAVLGRYHTEEISRGINSADPVTRRPQPLPERLRKAIAARLAEEKGEFVSQHEHTIIITEKGHEQTT